MDTKRWNMKALFWQCYDYHNTFLTSTLTLHIISKQLESNITNNQTQQVTERNVWSLYNPHKLLV